MKKFILIFLVLSSVNLIKSQALVFPNSQWFCSFQTLESSGVEHLQYFSDTIILNVESHAITRYIQYNDWNSDITYSFHKDPFFVYSNDDQVFHYVQGEFRLLYDLSASVGDTLITYAEENNEDCGSIGFSTIDSVGIMNINGLDLRFIRLIDGFESPVSYYGYVFERMGPIGTSFTSSGGSFVPYSNLTDCMLVDGDNHSGFKCYSDESFFFSKQDTTDFPCEYQPVGIEEFEENLLNVYPNPSNGRFVVELPEFHSGTFNLSVHDALGNEIFSQNHLSDMESEINLSGFSDGVYFVRLTIDGNNAGSRSYGNTFTSKIVKRSE